MCMEVGYIIKLTLLNAKIKMKILDKMSLM